VPPDSEEAELLRLQRASAFMHEVRLAQAGTPTRFSGRNRLYPEQTRAITQAMESSALVAAVKAAAQIDLPVNRLAERFEEMCRRQGMTMDAELRPSVVKLLAAELWVNQIALGVRAEKIMSATLHQGAVAPELLKEFPENPAYVITCALEHAPAASGAFLRRTREEIASISSDPEFQILTSNRPSEIMQTVIHHPSDARNRLLRAQEEMKGRWLSQKRKPGHPDTVPEEPQR